MIKSRGDRKGLGWGLLGRWKVLPLAIGLLMSPLLNTLRFLPLPDTWVPTGWPDWLNLYVFVVPNAIVGTSWVLLGWVFLSGRRGLAARTYTPREQSP